VQHAAALGRRDARRRADAPPAGARARHRRSAEPQVIARKELEGLRVRLPAATRNMYVDGHKPKPH
jgi:hypothetical protein